MDQYLIIRVPDSWGAEIINGLVEAVIINICKAFASTPVPLTRDDLGFYIVYYSAQTSRPPALVHCSLVAPKREPWLEQLGVAARAILDDKPGLRKYPLAPRTKKLVVVDLIELDIRASGSAA